MSALGRLPGMSQQFGPPNRNEGLIRIRRWLFPSRQVNHRAACAAPDSP